MDTDGAGRKLCSSEGAIDVDGVGGICGITSGGDDVGTGDSSGRKKP
jgi:hypothetical protein